MRVCNCYDCDELRATRHCQNCCDLAWVTITTEEYEELLLVGIDYLTHVAEIGVSIERGWWPLALRLHSAIKRLLPGYELHQVKEKFGGLRFYCAIDSNEEARALIRTAEEESIRTCETCGEIGKRRDDLSWIRTLCELHYTVALERSGANPLTKMMYSDVTKGRDEDGQEKHWTDA